MTTPHSLASFPAIQNRLERIVGHYTALAAATGAVPLPAASAAIIAETSAMLTHLSAVAGRSVTLWAVVQNIGVISAINLFGKALFIELARTLGFLSGGPLIALLLSGCGAATAGVQTYVLGMIAIAILENGGHPLPDSVVQHKIDSCKDTYQNFVDWSRREGLGEKEQ
jgi:uncharacterized protein (DUF697 family)